MTYLAINTRTLKGSLAIVTINSAAGSPKAMKPHPTYSIIVMLE